MDRSENVARGETLHLQKLHMRDWRPDGGTLAWLHVLAGHLLLLDNQ